MRTKQNQFAQKSSGFSIIEVPIALAIIVVVLVIFAGASNTMLLNRNSRDEDVAHHIAVSEIEDLRNLGYGNLPASGNFAHSQLSSLPNGSDNLTVSDYNSDTKQVVVTVTWVEPVNTATHNISLTTLINKNGL